MQQYDPITGAIDLSAHNMKSMKTEMARECANFSSITDDLTADQILGDAGQQMLNAEINEDALRLLASNSKTRAALNVTTASIEAIIAAPTPADGATQIAPAACKQSGSSKVDSMIFPADFNIIIQVPTPATRKPSPDMVYIVDPTNTSLVWTTVAAGWFALSSLPLGCMAVAAAGALVDFAVFIARH